MAQEFLDIRDENGNVTGQVKERSLVHRDGDIHGTSHVWIARRNEEGVLELLLQKRSANKDSHPSCYDTSSAGHIPAGQDFLESAIRELEEELGITAREKDLDCVTTHDGYDRAYFYGRPFNNHEISKIYVYTKPVDIATLSLQESEVESVCWQEAHVVLEHLRAGDKNYCMYLDAVEQVVSYLEKNL